MKKNLRPNWLIPYHVIGSCKGPIQDQIWSAQLYLISDKNGLKTIPFGAHIPLYIHR